MDIDLQLRAMLVRQDPGDAFTEGVMQRLGDQSETLPAGITRLGDARQRRQRRILWGGLLVLAAAAATMPGLLRPRASATDAVAQAPPASPVGEPAPVAPAGPPEAPEGAADAPITAMDAVAPVQPGIHIMVMRAGQRNDAEASRPAVDAFRRLLMLELDALPGIIVHDAEYAAAALSGGRTSRVVIAALSEADDAPTPAGGARVHAAIALQGGAQPADMGLTFVVDAAGAKQGIQCEGRVRMGSDASNRGFSAAGRLIGESRCTTVADVAAALVAFVRPQFESPAPRTVARADEDVLAMLRDPSADAALRSQALWQLTVDRAEGRGAELTADAVVAIAEFTAGLAASERLQVWRRLGTVGDPALIDGLIRVAREDPDEQVRLEVIALLARHAAVPGVRAALEQAAQADIHATVRLAASRAMQEEESWRAHVLATLRDADLAPVERMTAFMHSIRTGSTPARRAWLRGLLADERVLRDLIDLLRVGHADPMVSSSRIMAVLGESGHPLVMGFFADLLLRDRGQPARSPRTPCMACSRTSTMHRCVAGSRGSQPPIRSAARATTSRWNWYHLEQMRPALQRRAWMFRSIIPPTGNAGRRAKSMGGSPSTSQLTSDTSSAVACRSSARVTHSPAHRWPSACRPPPCGIRPYWSLKEAAKRCGSNCPGSVQRRGS